MKGMKTLRSVLAIALLIGLGISLTPAQADTTPTLSKSGVTLSFPNPIYTLSTYASVVANYENKSGFSLGSLRYEVTDKFGTVVAGSGSGAYHVKDGTSGTIVLNWFAYEFDKTTAPYTISLVFSYEYGSGKSDVIVSSPFEFTPRVAVLPTPIPTVTVTATPAPAPTVTVTANAGQIETYLTQLESLKTELSKSKSDLKVLTAKLKKICAVKPKPKGC